jgi:spore germination protein GerM
MKRTLAILVVAFLAGACGQSTGDLGSVATPPPTVEPSIELPSEEPTPGSTGGQTAAPSATPAATTAGTTTVRSYFILGSFVDNAGLVPVLREVPKTKAVGAAAMAELLKGPNEDELGGRPAMYTAIPDGTRFLGLTIDNGIATVNLSREFESGGGAATVIQRLAQVVYTLTQFPTVTGVSFQIDGVPKPVFGGDGTTFDGPVGRADYTDQLPAIFVDRPAWGGVLGNPARLVGVANVFEATFRTEILDGAGRVLASSRVMATCGSGCWGDFDVTIRYDVGKAGWGTLRVFEPSARDGSSTNTTEYPVWLTP